MNTCVPGCALLQVCRERHTKKEEKKKGVHLFCGISKSRTVYRLLYLRHAISGGSIVRRPLIGTASLYLHWDPEGAPTSVGLRKQLS